MSPVTPPTLRSKGAHPDAVHLARGWLDAVSIHRHDPRLDVHPDASHPFDLVLFDMDGTLTDGLSSWELVHQAFGVDNEANWLRYREGEITDEEFVRSDIELWHADEDERVHVDDVKRALARIEYLKGARDVITALRERGIATCILSGGIDLMAHDVAEDLGIDMYIANGLWLTDTGHLQGEGLCYVKIRDKATPTRELLRRLGVRPERVASVGNSEYDVGMFRETGLGIAVNPADPVVTREADVVLEGKDLTGALPFFLGDRSNPRRQQS